MFLLFEYFSHVHLPTRFYVTLKLTGREIPDIETADVQKCIKIEINKNK